MTFVLWKGGLLAYILQCSLRRGVQVILRLLMVKLCAAICLGMPQIRSGQEFHRRLPPNWRRCHKAVFLAEHA